MIRFISNFPAEEKMIFLLHYHIVEGFELDPEEDYKHICTRLCCWAYGFGWNPILQQVFR